MFTLFLILFLDLVGFSIIFPLFPHLLQYYLLQDPENFFLKTILDFIQNVNIGSNIGDNITTIVLFGGILGALYSALQFFFSPLWGALSDRWGRKPILVISCFGMILSYALWIFADSFTLLLVSRLLAGLMAGNIAVATAVIGDVTEKNQRAGGMTLIGIAFGLGFIIGPALGGIFSLVDLTKLSPSLISFGINPFSTIAIVAFVFSLINFFLILFLFSETLPANPEKNFRTVNPLRLFRPLPHQGVHFVNLVNFLFLISFSAMEFTLVFLSTERFQFSPLKNAYLFTFVGVVNALVQGGFVRKRAHHIGEVNLTLTGFALLFLGFLILSFASSVVLLFFGLFFIATGAALIIPCLPAIVSLNSPETEQGYSLGIFRSLGAFGRMLGPLLGCILYWRLGGTLTYFIAAFFLILPFLLTLRLRPYCSGNS